MKLDRKYFLDTDGKESLARVVLNRAFWVYSTILVSVAVKAIMSEGVDILGVLKDMAANYLYAFVANQVGNGLVSAAKGFASRNPAVTVKAEGDANVGPNTNAKVDAPDA